MQGNSIEKRCVLLFICIIIVLSYSIKPTVWLDLFRYYQYSEEIPIELSILDYISYELSIHVDFIYYLCLFFVKKANIPVQVVTCVFSCMYYIQIIYIIEYYRKKLGEKQYSVLVSSLMIFSTLMACGPLLVLTISRQLSAICFLLSALISYLNRKYFLMSLFVLIALMTHVGVFIFLLVLLFAYLIWIIYKKFAIRNRTIKMFYIIPITFTVLVGNIGLLFLSVISFLLSPILPPAYVEAYLQMTTTSNIIQTHTRFINALPVLLIYLGTTILIMIVRKINFMILVTISLSFFMILFSFSFPFIGQRMNLILPISFYFLLDGIIADKSINLNFKKLSLFIMFGIICCYLFELYLCRNLF